MVVLVLAGAGYAGYVLGKPDVEAEGLQAAAVAEGREAGAAKGAKQGYEQGFDSAREREYAPVYAAAYRDAYASEFERAGLDPPERIRVPR